MARIRSISPEACESRTLAQLTDFEERTFVRMWTHMDDQGRSKDDALLLCSKVYAVMRNISEDVVEAALVRFDELGLIIRYEARGQRWLQIRSWPRHQSPQKPAQARIPEPPGWHIDDAAKEWVRDDCTSPPHHPEPPPPVALPDPSGRAPVVVQSSQGLEVGSRSLEVGDRNLEVGTRNSSSSGCLDKQSSESVDDDDASLSPKQTAKAALQLIAQQRTDAALAAGQIDDPTLRGVNGYRQRVRQSLEAEMGGAALAIVLATPSVTPEALAGQLERLASASLAPPGNVHPLRPQPDAWTCPLGCTSHAEHPPMACPNYDETSAG